MKILVVCQYYYPEPFRITDICEELVRMGHEVTVLTGLPNYPMGVIPDEYKHHKKRNENINGVKVIRVWEIPRNNKSLSLMFNYISFMIAGTIKAFLMKQRYDVVFVNQLSPVLMAVPAIVYAKKNSKNIFLYSLDIWPESLIAYNITSDSIVYKIMLNVSKWIYNKAQMIAVTSIRFSDYYRNIISYDKEIRYLPQYAEDLFGNIEKKEHKGCNLVFAGNIGTVQNVQVIISAAKLLFNYKDIVFHIVGDGAEYENCKNDAKGLDNIIFYGRHSLEEMKKFYEIADAMLITLKDDKLLSYTLPGKIQTYMAAGKPIIGSINGETRRVINEAKCGYCVEADNAKALAEAILRFEKNRSLHSEMGRNSLLYYKKHFSKEVFLKMLEDMLEECI